MHLVQRGAPYQVEGKKKWAVNPTCKTGVVRFAGGYNGVTILCAYLYFDVLYLILVIYIHVYISSTHQSWYTVSKKKPGKLFNFRDIPGNTGFWTAVFISLWRVGFNQYPCIPMNIHRNHSLPQSKGALLCKAQLLPVGIFNPSVDLSRNDLSESFQKVTNFKSSASKLG